MTDTLYLLLSDYDPTLDRGAPQCVVRDASLAVRLSSLFDWDIETIEVGAHVPDIPEGKEPFHVIVWPGALPAEPRVGNVKGPVAAVRAYEVPDGVWREIPATIVDGCACPERLRAVVWAENADAAVEIGRRKLAEEPA